MNHQEGVIRFDLDFRVGPPPGAEMLLELEGWRTIFRRLGLLGCDPARYDGLGFGNLSRRAIVGLADSFIISGTQTGRLERLDPEHYVTVLSCDPARNRVVASGPVQPSSEALSHGILYQTDPTVTWVMHLHSPEIFAAGKRLGLPTTAPDAIYGSPRLAAEIGRLAPSVGRPGLLVMGGHQDGILVFGSQADTTALLAVATLARALAA